MMLDSVPKAEVLFTDGHSEKSVEVFMFTSRDFFVVTQSGSYKPNDSGFYILKYHPENTVAEIRMNGTVLYDTDSCWVPDVFVKEIRLWFEKI